MGEAADLVLCSVLIGAGATAAIDLWALALRRLFGLHGLDYALVGRWFAHLGHFRLHHDRIAGSPAVHGERVIGWTAHYLIGIAFASVLLAFQGLEWVREPTLGPALIVGIGSVAAPFLVMQPAMGAGIAARRTPRPQAARLRTLTTHTVFGLALFVCGRLMSLLYGYA